MHEHPPAENLGICLLDVPGLEGLAKTCRELNVTITAHGGLVRRLAQALVGQSSSRVPDVYALTPFGSDIDLVHSGPSSTSASVLHSIGEHVPGSECFRWEIRSEAEDLRFREALKVSDIAPINLLRLSNRPGSGFDDPWNALDDLRHGTYRFIRNGFYHTSPLFRAGRDLEVFAALLYLRALADANRMRTEGPGKVRPALSAVRETLREAMNRTTVILLQERAYLRARLRQLVRNLGVSVARSEHRKAAAMREVSDLLEFLEGEVPALYGLRDLCFAGPLSTIVASERLGGDTYRLPQTTSGWLADQDAELTLRKAASALPSRVQRPPPKGDHVVLASQPLAVGGGTAVGEDYLGESTNSAHEIVEFAIPLGEGSESPIGRALQRFEDEDLAMIFALVTSEGETAALFSSPSACTLAHRTSAADGDKLVYVRGSCFRVLERAANVAKGLQGRPHLQVFLVGSHGGVK